MTSQDSFAGRVPPTWLVEKCPDWCVRAHHEEDHVEDRIHQDAGTLIPVVTRDPLADSTHASELVVQLERRVGHSDTWVIIAETEGRGTLLMLTPESMDRLTGAWSIRS